MEREQNLKKSLYLKGNQTTKQMGKEWCGVERKEKQAKKMQPNGKTDCCAEHVLLAADKPSIHDKNKGEG